MGGYEERRVPNVATLKAAFDQATIRSLGFLMLDHKVQEAVDVIMILIRVPRVKGEVYKSNTYSSLRCCSKCFRFLVIDGGTTVD